MIRVFTERYYPTDFNTVPAENENFLPKITVIWRFPLQVIISQKWQQ